MANLKFMKRKALYLSIFISPVVNLYFAGLVQAAPAPIVTSTLETEDRQDNAFGIGATVSVAQRPFIGVENQTTSLLYLSYKYKRFYIEGLDVGFRLFTDKSYNIDLLATPRYYEVEAGFAKNGELDGIDKTRPTYLAGVSSQFHTKLATLTVQLLNDLQESDGNEAVVSASKAFKPTSQLSLSPSISLTYQDSRLVDHFYGVQAHEARTNRPAYQGRATVNYNAALTASWYLTQQIELLGQIKYEVLGNGITDSPIVDEDSIASATLGAVYRF